MAGSSESKFQHVNKETIRECPDCCVMKVYLYNFYASSTWTDDCQWYNMSMMVQGASRHTSSEAMLLSPVSSYLTLVGLYLLPSLQQQVR